MLINDEPKNPIHRSHQKVPLAFNASYKPFLTLESEQSNDLAKMRLYYRQMVLPYNFV